MNRDIHLDIDPTIDDFCFLMSIVLKTVNPAINREVAHDLLVEMVESNLSETSAAHYGELIKASVELQDREDLN